jgi:hypothetical protein
MGKERISFKRFGHRNYAVVTTNPQVITLRNIMCEYYS